MSVTIHFPKNRLAELTGRFGGMKRDEAVAAAAGALDTLRPEADRRIEAAIVQLEEMAFDAKGAQSIPGDLSPAQMRTFLPVADRIVTLTGTYGYRALDHAAKSLCDLIAGLIEAGRGDLASIRVHVRTIRMVAPSSPSLPEQHIDVLLFELQKLLDHHGIVPPPPDEGSESAVASARDLKLV
jgi:hypothetical protein